MSDTTLEADWPRHGMSEDDVRAQLLGLLHRSGDIIWGTTCVLGFPTMKPLEFGVEMFAQVQQRHLNAILTHTRGNGEKGFDGVKAVERAVISMVGGLLGDRMVDGYITSGGTEANIMGIWVGRQYLREAELAGHSERIVVLASPASHYSLRKACALTDLGEGSWSACACPGREDGFRHFTPSCCGLHFVPCDASGAINVEALESYIRYLHNKGVVRFLIFLNEGTTLTGAMDDTAAVGQMISRLKGEWGENHVAFYLHVDAAYGAFIYPFLKPDDDWAFRVPEVCSLTADPYKMGQTPMAQGIFLCRKGLQRHIQRTTGYVQDELDDTLIGSRSGANAAACYAVFCSQGFEGFRLMHQASVQKAQYLHDQLGAVCGIERLPQMLNMVAFYLPSGLSAQVLGQVHQVVHDFYVMSDLLNTDPENRSVHPRRIVKCNITRDTQTEWMDRFVAALRDILGSNC